MKIRIRDICQEQTWGVLRDITIAKCVTFLVIAIVPGGLVLPVCYAAYVAFRQSLTGREKAPR